MADINKPQEFKSPTGPSVAEEASRRSGEAMQQGGRAVGESARHGADAAADLTRQAGRTGADAMHRAGEAAGETMQRSTQALAEAQRQIAQEAAERFQEVSRKLAEAARGTSEEVTRMFALPNAAQGGLRDMQQGVSGLVEGVMQTNVRAMQELFRLGNPASVIELQQRFVREYLDALTQGTATLVQAIRRTADETLRPLEQQVEQRKQDERFRHAAE